MNNRILNTQLAKGGLVELCLTELEFARALGKQSKLVLADFNDYLDKKINPQLPRGYEIMSSSYIYFEKGKFRIDTGDCIYPEAKENCANVEEKIMTLLHNYMEETPVVGEIVPMFSIRRHR